MDVETFRICLAHLGFSARRFALTIGADERTAKRWSAGGPHLYVRALVRALLLLTPEQLERWIEAQADALADDAAQAGPKDDAPPAPCPEPIAPSKSDQVRALLGTMTDSDVARAVGCSRSLVQQVRRIDGRRAM